MPERQVLDDFSGLFDASAKEAIKGAKNASVQLEVSRSGRKACFYLRKKPFFIAVSHVCIKSGCVAKSAPGASHRPRNRFLPLSPFAPALVRKTRGKALAACPAQHFSPFDGTDLHKEKLLP
jgi:hypothetical protein